MWLWAVAAVTLLVIAVVLVRRRRKRRLGLPILDGTDVVCMWEFNGPPAHSSQSTEGLAMAQGWAGRIEPPMLDASKRAYLEQHRQEIQSALRQSVPCAHCSHAARYHANKGLDPKGKCDPWYMGDRCDCTGFEPATSEQSAS